MVLIGVTGGIGSGKSTVCSLFEKKGVPIFYADTVARDISETTALNEILRAFGPEVAASPTSLDRKKLAAIVFQDPAKLELLNSILHPKVFDAYEQWKSGLSVQTKFALVEAALMFESGMFQMMHYVLAVITDDQKRIERTVARDHTNEESVLARMKNQISLEEMLELSDFQIHNNGSMNDLAAKVQFFALLFSTLTVPPEPI